MTQTKEKLNQFHKIFQNSMTYPKSMVWRQVVDFNFTQWDDIEPSITKALQFIDTYRYNNEFQDYGEQRKYIEIYAVACLPFLLADFKIENPDIEDREFNKKTLAWFKFIKHNRGMTDYFIHQITTDDSISRIVEGRLDEQIAVYQWYVDTAKKTTKKRNWSNVLQFLYLADTVDKLWSSGELDKKKDFLYQLFSIFDEEIVEEITPDVIEKSMIVKARECPLINVSKEHIEKVLSLPKNKLTEKQIRDEFHISLADSLM